MGEVVRRYRMKLTLEDGRKVYATKDGKIETRSGAGIKGIKPEAWQIFGYSPDLTLFSLVSSLAKWGIEPVRVKRCDFELASLPLDPAAVVRSADDGQD